MNETSASYCINHNLNLLYQAEDYKLLRSDFVGKDNDENGIFSITVNEAIDEMLKEDLIETESGSEGYFLTTYAFEVLESGGWDLNTTSKKSGNDPLTLENFGQALEKAVKEKRKVYPFIWAILLALAVFASLNYWANEESKDDKLPAQIELPNTVDPGLDSLK